MANLLVGRVSLHLHTCRALSSAAAPRPPLFKARERRLRFLKPCRNYPLPIRMAMASPSPPSSSVAMVGARDSIALTEIESTIFEALKAVLVRFGLNTQLRVAGGWVRDKLLGKDCYDVDIALDNMLGREFCEKVNDYLHSIGEEAHSVGVIQSNPEQSKHLETARMRIFGIWVDFVNLRAETYADNSRIPDMEFGTPKQDAFRRDLTINSLFYNINTSEIEDLTGRGIHDLKAGKIVTPLPPKETFLDDPLRVLRAIRFGARFEYELVEELKKAASDEDVKAALGSKVSKERIGHEIDLIIYGNQPVRAIRQLVDLCLFWSVFTLPPNLTTDLPEDIDKLCADSSEVVWKVLQGYGPSKIKDEHRRICLFAALLLPLRSVEYTNEKKKVIRAPTFIIRESLKLKASDAERVVALHQAAEKWAEIMDLLLQKGNGACNLGANINENEEWETLLSSQQLIQAGLLLKEIKDLWRAALLLSSALDTQTLISSDIEKKVSLCLAVEDVITKLELDNVWEKKVILDGKVIMAELGLKTGGPLIKEWQNRVIRWQLAHPNGTRDDCLEWFRQTNVKRFKSSPA